MVRAVDEARKVCMLCSLKNKKRIASINTIQKVEQVSLKLVARKKCGVSTKHHDHAQMRTEVAFFSSLGMFELEIGRGLSWGQHCFKT